MSAPATDNLKFGRRAPRRIGEADKTVPIAYIELPVPDPSTSVSIVDVASGTLINSQSRAVSIDFTAETGAVIVQRDNGVSESTPSTLPNGTFYINGPQQNDTYSAQKAATVPVRILRMEEQDNGVWAPIVSRGIFYQVYQMTSEEGESSWLRTAGFTNGQYLALAYSTEPNWRYLSGATRWTSSGASGGGGVWRSRHRVDLLTGTRTVTLTPSVRTSSLEGTRILALGGLTTDTGIELLVEAPTFSRVNTLQAPGVNGTIGAVSYSIYAAQSGATSAGRLRTNTTLATGQITPFPNLTSLLSNAGITATAENVVARYTGSFYVPTEGFYTFSFAHGGKIRFYHWNIPVVDTWYGSTNTSAATRSSYYSGYFHAGWHDFALEWAPDTPNSAFTLTTQGQGTLLWATNTTTRSLVQKLDPTNGQLTLKESFLSGMDNLSTPLVFASFAYTSQAFPFCGYFSGGVFQELDLNPSANRLYGAAGAGIPTKTWALSTSCWLYLLPTMACALTDASGNSLATGSRNWISAGNYGISGTLRWASVAAPIATGTSGIPFGSISSIDGAVLGRTPYSSIGTIEGTSSLTDPRGDYASGAIIGHLNVVSGTPDLQSLLYYDLRSRGGGLHHETSPSDLPTGGPQERANTFWDLSPWDGYETSVNGTVVVDIPESILTGTDGGPIFTTHEVEDLVQQTVPAGIRSVIRYV